MFLFSYILLTICYPMNDSARNYYKPTCYLLAFSLSLTISTGLLLNPLCQWVLYISCHSQLNHNPDILVATKKDNILFWCQFLVSSQLWRKSGVSQKVAGRSKQKINLDCFLERKLIGIFLFLIKSNPIQYFFQHYQMRLRVKLRLEKTFKLVL